METRHDQATPSIRNAVAVALRQCGAQLVVGLLLVAVALVGLRAYEPHEAYDTCLGPF